MLEARRDFQRNLSRFALHARDSNVKLSSRDAQGISIGIESVVSVLLGLAAGYWLDKKLGTSPWFTLVGIVLGFAAGLRSLIGMVQRNERANSPEPEQRPQDGDPPS